MRRLLLPTALLGLLFTMSNANAAHERWQCHDQGIGINKTSDGKLSVSQTKTGAESLPPLRLTLDGQQLRSCTMVGCWAGQTTVTQAAAMVHAHGMLKWDNPDEPGTMHFQLSIERSTGIGALVATGITPLLCKSLTGSVAK